MPFAYVLGGFHLVCLHSVFSCDKRFYLDHTMNCPTGGHPTLRHNELRDYTANALSEVCSSVCVEPSLQTLSGETHFLLKLLRMGYVWMHQLMAFGVADTRDLTWM